MPLSGIGMGEMIVIAMLVLIVFGPKRLPEITRTLGKAMREFRKGMNEIQRELEMADRDTSRSPAKPKSPSIAPPAVVGTTVAGGGEPTDGDAAEGGDAADADDSGDDAPASRDEDELPAASTPEADAAPDAQLAHQDPPEVRPGYVDPAEEFIDPWSTDSSKPSIPPRQPALEQPASQEPAPQPTAPRQPDSSGDEAGENPAD